MNRMMPGENAEDQINMESARILIVDDEPVIVQVISRQLKEAGCIVRSASNAEDTVLLARENHFDLILLDINLPGASGFSVINALKNMSAAIILVMTGHADEDIRKDAILLGATELIAKPFEHQELISVIRDSASRKTASASIGKNPLPPQSHGTFPGLDKNRFTCYK